MCVLERTSCMRSLLLALSILAAAAPIASANCTLPSNASAKRYWPTSTTILQPATDQRCTTIAGLSYCQLSGWLFKPAVSPLRDLPAIVYIHGSGEKKDSQN